MKKILIAMDDSKGAMKAVEYVAQQYGGAQDLTVVLAHVLPNLPSIFWDEGHILSEEEKKERSRVVDKWIADRRAKMEPVFRKAVSVLSAQGIPEQRIQTRSISDSTDVAASLLEEARDGGCQTIVTGRRGIAETKYLLMGSVTNKIVTQGSGMAITIVE